MSSPSTLPSHDSLAMWLSSQIWVEMLCASSRNRGHAFSPFSFPSPPAGRRHGGDKLWIMYTGHCLRAVSTNFFWKRPKRKYFWFCGPSGLLWTSQFCPWSSKVKGRQTVNKSVWLHCNKTLLTKTGNSQSCPSCGMLTPALENGRVFPLACVPEWLYRTGHLPAWDCSMKENNTGLGIHPLSSNWAFILTNMST